MERLKNIKDTIIGTVQGQLGKLESTDTKELGEAIDMIKDLSKAIYYCSIVKAMEECEKEEEIGEYLKKMVPGMEHMAMMQPGYDPMSATRNYTPMMDRPWEGWPPPYDGPRYYGTAMSDRGTTNNSGNRDGRSDAASSTREGRDSREGRSPDYRRTYMESKELHKDKSTKMKELEKYMQELSHDLLEMIEDASIEEKQLLQSKISTLASKIA